MNWKDERVFPTKLQSIQQRRLTSFLRKMDEQAEKKTGLEAIVGAFSDMPEEMFGMCTKCGEADCECPVVEEEPTQEYTRCNRCLDHLVGGECPKKFAPCKEEILEVSLVEHCSKCNKPSEMECPICKAPVCKFCFNHTGCQGHLPAEETKAGKSLAGFKKVEI